LRDHILQFSATDEPRISSDSEAAFDALEEALAGDNFFFCEEFFLRPAA